MARPIILAMEEYEGTDPNDLDFSDFEPVMGSEGNDLISEMDSTIEVTDSLDTHMEITDIIATEGVGNRPQIAAIALSALETRLFGKPVVGTRVGTESRTRIATEGKNIFMRAWDAISKFFKKMWERIQSVFGEDKKKKTKKKAKQVKEAKVDQAFDVMVVMSSNSFAKDVIEVPGPIPEEKVETIIEEVREKVGKDVTDDLDRISYLVKNNLKATKMLSENINFFAGKDCKGPREIIEQMDQVFRFINVGYDQSMLKNLDNRIEVLKDLGKLRDGYEKHMTNRVLDSADQNIFLEARNTHLVLSKSLIPGYYTVAKENSKYSSFDVMEHELVRLTKEDIVNAKPNFYDQYMYILKNKNNIASKMEKIADFNDTIKSLSDDIKKYSDKIDGLKKSIDKKKDPKIREVGTAVLDDFKGLLNTLKSHVTVANACILFADSLHQSIMQLSDE